MSQIYFDVNVACHVGVQAAVLYWYLENREKVLLNIPTADDPRSREERLRDGGVGQQILFEEINEALAFMSLSEIKKAYQILQKFNYLQFSESKAGFFVTLSHGLKEEVPCTL